MDYRAEFPQLAGQDAAALKRRMKTLESQFKQMRSRSEELGKVLNSIGSSGMPPQDMLNEIGGLSQGMKAAEEEMAAITAFMEELEGGG
ncbi:hypothetical protein [Ralstonia mannitolilytica]|uniref:hypothetical protein n=1 Tax=Ralstonia mannitolilytica TaxID=105219 RepID=UPI00292D248A|nr:hypothetical protein [Ralstonia mannitolilytica]